MRSRTHAAAADQLRTVFGRQVLGLALCRYVLRLPPVAAMPAEELVAAIGATLQRYLFGDLDGA